MNEDFLHFIFQYKLWSNEDLYLTDGQKFEIINVGTHNFDSGPDFFNAKIKINDTVWAGNIEIHQKSSDWYNHKHHKDPAYDNVILHVVFLYDKPIFYKKGSSEVPTWEIKFDQALFNSYAKIKNKAEQINCEKYINLVEKEKINLFFENLGVERLEYKLSEIKKILEKTNNDWEESFYIYLAHAFGFNINSLPFEMTAYQTPLNIVRKVADDIYKLEALLFGQSGLFQISVPDAYFMKLFKEYEFLRQKYEITPIDGSLWKKSKTRLANTPHVRIAQFAKILTNFQGLFAAITESRLNEIKNFFMINPSNYWTTHYAFGKPNTKLFAKLGEMSYEIIVINTIAPFLFSYFSIFNPEKCEEVYYVWLSKLKAENNTEIRTWEKAGIKPKTAYESQALLHLKKNYCDKTKCLDCNIGYEILNKINKIPLNE